jgi:hypothetical protein
MLRQACYGSCVAFGFALCSCDIAVAADCPSSKKPAQVFDVSVAGNSTTEVYRLENGDTRTVTRFSGGAVAEQTFYRGLVRIEHWDSGQRTFFKPMSDLATLFPLKAGRSRRFDFEVQTGDGQKKTLHAEFKVVGKDRVEIGACRYYVIKIEHRNSFNDGPMPLINTDWYAPEIRLILAREYQRSNGETVIHKYTRLVPRTAN